jgi:hypothetical protein
VDGEALAQWGLCAKNKHTNKRRFGLNWVALVDILRGHVCISVLMWFLNVCVVVLRCSEQNVVLDMLIAPLAYISVSQPL